MGLGSRTAVPEPVVSDGAYRVAAWRASAAVEPALQAYLLGTVEFEAALALQRQLLYQVAGERSGAALVLCEHAPLITVGRQGSTAHILCDPAELRTRRWR